jgi:hypothetical protein
MKESEDNLKCLKVKGKYKVIPVRLLTEHHAIKAYWGNGGMAPLIL